MKALRRGFEDLKAMRQGTALPPVTSMGPHEAWLIRPLLRRTVLGILHQEVSSGVRRPVSARQRRERVVEERQQARRFLNSMSLLPRVVLIIPMTLLFIPVTLVGAWDTWAAELVIALLALLLLGTLTASLRMMLLPVVAERHARLLEPWNGDLVWQALAIFGLWVIFKFQ